MMQGGDPFFLLSGVGLMPLYCRKAVAMSASKRLFNQCFLSLVQALLAWAYHCVRW